MSHRQSGMTPALNRFRVRLLLFCCLWGAFPAWAAQVLLTGAVFGAGVQAFAQALAQQRPQDDVRFELLANLPAPGQLPAGTRLILLDPASLEWRQQEAQGPATLVLRIGRIQAQPG